MESGATHPCLQVGGHPAMIWPGEGWPLPGLLAQDILNLNEYFFSFQPKYVKGTGQVLRNPTTTLGHAVDDEEAGKIYRLQVYN